MALDYTRRLELIESMINDDLSLFLNDDTNRKSAFGAAFIFNNIFEESWKLMKDVLIEFYGFTNESEEVLGGPKLIINTALTVKLITTDRWLKILMDRNNTTHDYSRQNMNYYFDQIKTEYIGLVQEFINKVHVLMQNGESI